MSPGSLSFAKLVMSSAPLWFSVVLDLLSFTTRKVVPKCFAATRLEILNFWIIELSCQSPQAPQQLLSIFPVTEDLNSDLFGLNVTILTIYFHKVNLNLPKAIQYLEIACICSPFFRYT